MFYQSSGFSAVTVIGGGCSTVVGCCGKTGSLWAAEQQGDSSTLHQNELGLLWSGGWQMQDVLSIPCPISFWTCHLVCLKSFLLGACSCYLLLLYEPLLPFGGKGANVMFCRCLHQPQSSSLLCCCDNVVVHNGSNCLLIFQHQVCLSTCQRWGKGLRTHSPANAYRGK